MEVGRPSPAKPWERTRGVGGSSTSPSTAAPPSSLGLPRRRTVGGVGGISPASTISAPALPIAPRAGRPGVGASYGGMSSYGGGGMDRYGGGSSYGGYGSSYGGSSYGSSYGSGSYGGYNSYGRAGYGGGMMSRYGGGYGSSSYGGGYGSSGYGSYGSSGYGGGYGGYGGGMMDRYGGGNGGYQKPEGLGFVRDFQVLADGFARFSRLLDANFDAMYGSLTSVSMLFEHLHNLRREIFFAFQAISLVGILRKIWTSWFGSASVPTLLNASSSTSSAMKESPQLDAVAFSQFEKKEADRTQRSRPLRALGLLFLIISAPFILAKLARMVMGIPPNASLLGDRRPKVLAIHDFQGETPEEISFRKGEAMFVLGEPFEGWLEIETVAGERGLIPANYVRPQETGNGIEGGSQTAFEDDSTVPLSEEEFEEEQ